MIIYRMAQGFAVLVALIHVYIVYLEMFLWTTPKGLKVFQMTLPRAEETKRLAFNQGLYNGFLAGGIFYGLLRDDISMICFMLVCVSLAGIVGGKTIGKKIFFVQTVPAALGLLFYFISTHL